MSFNLIEASWIPVLRTNGHFERLGIRRTLTEAGTIRQIAASNPMDNVALLRFLMAVLLWCRPGLSEEDRKLMHGDAKGTPPDWLTKLNEHKKKFDLFDPKQPFMQDLAVEDEGTNAATELLHDLPSGSALNHFRHTRDSVDGLCPACCALGLVRWPCYAAAGTKGRGKQMTASPNGNTPTYAFPVCNTLLMCLAMSLTRLTASHNDAPIWISSDCPTTIGPLSGLTWRSRRILLGRLAESADTSCSYCGSNDRRLVREIRFQPGWERLSSEPWDGDPHLVRVTRKKGSKGATAQVLIAHPGPNEAIDRSGMLWRDLTHGVADSTPANSDRSRPHDVVVIGSAQALLKHAEVIRVAPSGDAAMTTRADLSKQCCEALRGTDAKAHPNETCEAQFKRRGVLRAATPNPDRQHPEIHAAFVLMTPSTEARVRALLNDPVAATDGSGFLNEVYQPLVQQVVTSTTRGSPLRRREAMARARSALDDAIRRVTAPPKPSAGGDKPKPTRKKEGGAA